MIVINIWPLVLSAFAAMALGTCWYGPFFGKIWMKHMGFTKEHMEQGKKGMGKQYALAFFASIVMAFILGQFIGITMAFTPEATALAAGLCTAFWTWLGFVAPVTLGMVLWEGKPWILWILLNSYQLVTLLAMGAILSFWM